MKLLIDIRITLGLNCFNYNPITLNRLLPMLMNGQVGVGSATYANKSEDLGMVAEEKVKYKKL